MMSTSRRSAMRRLVRDAYARRGVVSNVRVVDSGSMRPLMAGERDLGVRWGLPSGSLAGAILLFEAEGGIVFVHRAAASRRGSNGSLEILHVADNYPRGDPYSAYWAPESHLLGEVIEIIDPTSGTRIDLTRPLTRLAGRIVAMAGYAAWRLDRTRCRGILAPPAFGLHRFAARVCVAVARCRRQAV
jgi:hypothetical protein